MFPYVFSTFRQCVQFHIEEFHNVSIRFHNLPPFFGRVCLEKNTSEPPRRAPAVPPTVPPRTSPCSRSWRSWELGLTSGKRLQQTKYGLYLVYIYGLYVLYMDYIWIIYGLYMVYIWFIWIIYGLYMDYIWFIWIIYG